jgi:hypothetical protein
MLKVWIDLHPLDFLQGAANAELCNALVAFDMTNQVNNLMVRVENISNEKNYVETKIDVCF